MRPIFLTFPEDTSRPDKLICIDGRPERDMSNSVVAEDAARIYHVIRIISKRNFACSFFSF
jgi:hypothetical protein